MIMERAFGCTPGVMAVTEVLSRRALVSFLEGSLGGSAETKLCYLRGKIEAEKPIRRLSR